MDLVRKWLVDFNAGKTQLVYFDWSNNIDRFDIIMAGSVSKKNPSFKMLGLPLSSKLHGLLH